MNFTEVQVAIRDRCPDELFTVIMRRSMLRIANILCENEEYAIVKSNSEYGLNVYDHIVLKGETVSEDDFVYE